MFSFLESRDFPQFHQGLASTSNLCLAVAPSFFRNTLCLILAMPNPFGLDFKDESIGTTFATCISCFDYALTASPNNQATLKLSVLRLRLTRWGEAVNIYRDPKLREAELHPDDLKEAKDALVELITRFEALSASANDDTEGSTADQPTDCEGAPPLLFAKLDEIACKRRDHRQHPGLLETRVLALGGRTKLLVEAGSVCADRLEEAFPASQRQRELCHEEMAGVLDRTILKVLQRAASGIDHWISRDGTNVAHFRSFMINAPVVVGVENGLSSRLTFGTDMVKEGEDNA
ncbi:unnamed protein product [Clonostachys chloroleuca]|uniref:Prion-inhibition and propagation HeLo domain-containing protein n=1 Tax=Clonostachys chloroleuca TaxID=1926264 RepID=A0AA35LZ63_9HYPO|nr:unnamed protein product [Clonostachys chloroleuca]